MKTPSTTTVSINPLFLDLGCCVGQDIRSLVHASVPSSRIVGAELEPAFIDLGYDLFQDRGKLGVDFLFGDILKINGSIRPSSPITDDSKSTLSSARGSTLQSLVGRVSILWCSAFLHLWDRPGQVDACRKMLLLMRNEKGVKIMGRHAGSRTPGLVKHITNPGGLMYKHNPESFQKMWEEEIIKDFKEGQGEGASTTTTSGGTSPSKWIVRAWFEEDLFLTTKAPQDAGQKPDSDWFTKVVGESSRLAEGSAGKEEKSNGDVRILVWEMERVE